MGLVSRVESGEDRRIRILMVFVLIYLRDDLALGFESAQYQVPCAAMLSRHN